MRVCRISYLFLGRRPRLPSAFILGRHWKLFVLLTIAPEKLRVDNRFGVDVYGRSETSRCKERVDFPQVVIGSLQVIFEYHENIWRVCVYVPYLIESHGSIMLSDASKSTQLLHQLLPEYVPLDTAASNRFARHGLL